MIIPRDYEQKKTADIEACFILGVAAGYILLSLVFDPAVPSLLWVLEFGWLFLYKTNVSITIVIWWLNSSRATSRRTKKSAIAHVHLLVFLPQVMIFQCLDCNRTFASAGARKSHSRATGHDIPNCGLCDRMFVDQQALIQVSTRVRVDNGSQFPWNA